MNSVVVDDECQAVDPERDAQWRRSHAEVWREFARQVDRPSARCWEFPAPEVSVMGDDQVLAVRATVRGAPGCAARSSTAVSNDPTSDITSMRFAVKLAT